MNAVEKITAERKRQIEEEGWTEHHDDEHGNGELLRAAVVYYHHALPQKFGPLSHTAGIRLRRPVGWPWSPEWWKPKSPERDLIRAGALCVAEIDRLKRKNAYFGHAEQKLRLITAALDTLPATLDA